MWEYIYAHDSVIDEVHGNTYFGEPIAFEMDDGNIKETIRPYTMGRIIDIERFLKDYPCDLDGRCSLTQEPAEYRLKMEIGTFTTLLLSYKTAERLYQLERIEGRPETVERLDDVLFHKIPYISDYI